MPTQKVNRSSKTGRFVSGKFAKKHKATTEQEVIKKKVRRKKKNVY